MINARQEENQYPAGKRKAAEIYPFIEAYLARRNEQIRDIMQMVERYEKKRSAEERVYHAMSPLRRMLWGKKPDHHLAVEYIHYVKKPMERVRKLRKEIEAAQSILDQSAQNDIIELPEDIEKELIERLSLPQ